MRFRSAVATFATLLCFARPLPAHAQLSSTHFKLEGTFDAGGPMTSTHFALRSGVGLPSGQRTSSRKYDLIPDFVGIAYSHVMTETYPTQAKRYELVAFPLQRADSSVSAVLGELGGYDIKSWRLGTWDPTTNQYLEPGSGLTKIQPVAGYWLITDVSHGNITDAGLPPAEIPGGVLNSYLLANGPAAAPGWNQLGNPWPFPININTILVRDQPITFFSNINNPANGITSQTVKVWDPVNEIYRDTTVINGRQGFWVKKLSPNPVYMYFLRSSSTVGSPAPDALLPERTSSRGAVAAVPDWSVSVVATEGSRRSQTMVVGAAPVTAGEWNPLCESTPPAPPGVTPLALRLPRAGWGRMSGDYTSVFEPATDHMSWNVVLSGGDAPGEVALDVTAANLPAGTRLSLTDLTTGDVRELVPGRSLTLAAYAGDRSYRLDASGSGLVATTSEPAGFVRVYPNPFRAASGLTFALGRAGDVAVDVFDLQGRHVARIAKAGLAPGEHVLVWDGRDDSGSLARSGVYLARWTTPERRGTTRLVKLD